MNIHARNAQNSRIQSLPAPPRKPAESQATEAPKPTSVLPEAQELKPADVEVVVQNSELAAGSSLSHVEIVDMPEAPSEAQAAQAAPAYQRPDLSQVEPRAVTTDEMENMLSTYNDNVKKRLADAKDGSLLHRFETSLRLMSMLNNPRLKEDPEASDILQMRRAQVEKEYKTLMDSPEVKAAFDGAQKDALATVFGEDIRFRSHQQASYLLSDTFQQDLADTPADKIQEKVQKELSALSLLNPRLAKNIADDLIEKTLRSQSLRMLQSNTEAGSEARENLGEALGVYLRAQQSAAGIGLQANNLTRLASLSDDKIKEITQAVAELAGSSEASDYNELAKNLLEKVDELPVDMQQDATRFLTHMQTQNVLGTVLLAGSVIGLTQRELPSDPKEWVSLTSASLGTASLSHFALRLAGLEKAADVASKMHYKLPVGSANIPVLGSVLTGVNITMDSMALYDEFHNEDLAGMTSRAMGVGSGIATLAAITVMSGPAAPITLIGSTVVGLAAWGVDAAWGESDLSGKVRQDLRTLGVSDQEQDIAEKFTRMQHQVNHAGWPGMGTIPFERSASREELQKKMANATLDERVAVVNHLMDQHTSGYEEKQLFDTVMQQSDDDFIALMNTMNSERLLEELESPADRKAVLNRMQSLSDQGMKKNAAIFGRLARLGDTGNLKTAWSKASPEVKQQVTAPQLKGMLKDLTDDWMTSDAKKDTALTLLQDPANATKLAENFNQPEGLKWFNDLREEFSISDQAKLLKHMQGHEELSAIFDKLYTPRARTSNSRRRYVPHLTHLDFNGPAAELTRELVKNMSGQEIRELNPDTRNTMKKLLTSARDSSFWNKDEWTAQILRL